MSLYALELPPFPPYLSFYSNPMLAGAVPLGCVSIRGSALPAAVCGWVRAAPRHPRTAAPPTYEVRIARLLHLNIHLSVLPGARPLASLSPSLRSLPFGVVYCCLALACTFAPPPYPPSPCTHHPAQGGLLLPGPGLSTGGHHQCSWPGGEAQIQGAGAAAAKRSSSSSSSWEDGEGEGASHLLLLCRLHLQRQHFAADVSQRGGWGHICSRCCCCCGSGGVVAG